MILRKLLLFVVASSLLIYTDAALVPQTRASASTTRYVDNYGTDSGGCSSPVSPCRTIQYAVNQSASGDRILVAQGTYTYHPDVDPCPFLQTRAVVCFVDKQLTILGGYSASNWYMANPVDNPTVIDGQNAHRGVAVIGYNTTTTHLTMEGFTIQNGRAQGPTYLTPYDPSGVGGGMLVQHAAVTLRDVVFRNNMAIGQNTTSGAGGQADGAALRIEQAPEGTTCLLQRVVFDNNRSLGGVGPTRGGVAFGALYAFRSRLIIEDSVFTNNLAEAGNSAGAGSGEGLHADALGGGVTLMHGTLIMRRVTVTENQVNGGNAATYGGGAFGGGIFVEDPFGTRETSFSISDSYVANNLALAGDAATGGNAAGGGMSIDSTTTSVVERVSIISNSAIGGSGENAGPGAGGGMYIFTTQPGGGYRATLRNVIIARNLADHGNGRIPNAGHGGGGGVVIHGMDADIIHTTIAHNRIGSNLVLGQALHILPWPSPLDPQFPASVYLNHSIIADHTEGGAWASAITVQKGCALTFDQGLFSGNTRDTNADGLPVPAGSINGQTTMRSALSAGFIAPSPPHYNYHLRKDSPARNQAIASSAVDDIDQQTRPYGHASDFGADEYHPFRLTVSPGDGILRLNWTAGAEVFRGGISHYELFVTCDVNASPPEQGDCEQPIKVGMVSTFTLTGLTNFKHYVVEVNAYNSAGELVAASTRVSAFPTTIFVFLPVVLR